MDSIRDLDHRGFAVRYFDAAWDALALFGEEMPNVAYIGLIPWSSQLELLFADLDRYGVPVEPLPRSGTVSDLNTTSSPFNCQMPTDTQRFER
ncbi:hypothetical protein ACLIMP_22715 [Novosphingobium aerophilum]|uniref:hypothetical protein n=1 Tax=Novosphingobium aerophilum TaxID=2839843 RepID=UPI00163DBFA4